MNHREQQTKKEGIALAKEASSELHKLRALNAELVADLKILSQIVEDLGGCGSMLKRIKENIAKAEGTK